MKLLYIYTNNMMAGILSEDRPGKGYVFRYDADYLLSEYPPISVTLPKRAEAYESASLFPFFTNLLPEGNNRKILCREFKIDEKDSFSILSALAGSDFIGAVKIAEHENH